MRHSLSGLLAGWRRTLRRGSGRIDKDEELGRFGDLLGFAKSDGFHAFVVQLKILRQVVANNFCASFGEHAKLVGIALCLRRGNDGETKRILFEKLPSIVQRFLVLQLRIIGLVENVFRFVIEFFGRRSCRKSRDGVLGQFASTVVPALFEKSAE